ncbi:MAG: hypothetical protein ACI4I4_07150 [Acutalibacteraceae bacterium]
MRYKSKHEKLKLHYSVLVFRIAALLACLTLITAYLLSGAYSRFFSGALGGDGARVAGFSPDFTSAKVLDFEKTPGYNAEIDFSVQNYSDEKLPETAMKCKIVFKTTGNIPLTFTLLDGAENQLQKWVWDGTSEEKRYEYTDGSLIFGVGTKEIRTYKLKAEWKSDKNDVRFSGLTDAVYLETVFKQID